MPYIPVPYNIPEILERGENCGIIEEMSLIKNEYGTKVERAQVKELPIEEMKIELLQRKEFFKLQRTDPDRIAEILDKDSNSIEIEEE